jgi:hypothetical protein
MAIKHTNAKTVWFTLESTGSGLESVMVIETDLHLNSQHSEYDQAAVNSLVEACQRYMEENKLLGHNRLRIVSIRKDQLNA